MLVEYDAVVYASLLIFLNVNLRNACKDILKDIFNQYSCSKVLNINQIKVHPFDLHMSSSGRLRQPQCKTARGA